MRRGERYWGLLAREILFKTFCRHRQGDKPNLLVFCTRRGGSTWLMNTIAAHPRCRYVNRPFLTATWSRHNKQIPDLAEFAGGYAEMKPEHFIAVAPKDEAQFRSFADDLIQGRIEAYPSLNFRAPYFHRVTDRMVFQMTNSTAMIDWFEAKIWADTAILYRHPISNALSIMRENWAPECQQFLKHQAYVSAYLDKDELGYAQAIATGGTLLEQHVLDWALKMKPLVAAPPPTQGRTRFELTYEECVIHPEDSIRQFAEAYGFEELEPMLEQVKRPSRTVTPDTASRVDDPQYVIGRWRQKVSDQEEQKLIDITHRLGVRIYNAGEDLAAPKYLHVM